MPVFHCVLTIRYGPPGGGAIVEVKGDNFAPGAVCTFGALVPSPATFYSVTPLSMSK